MTSSDRSNPKPSAAIKPFEGRDRRVARVRDALSRAFVASNELGHSYVGQSIS